MKTVFDTNPATSPDSACANGRIVFHEFLHPLPDSDIDSLVVVMTEVVRQSGDPRFGLILQAMRDGNVSREDARILWNRSLSRLPKEERDDFLLNALFIMATWKETVPITMEYLIRLCNPVARIDTIYQHPPNRPNHAMKEINLPARSALAVGATVMLLTNIITELNLMNGSVGTVRQIVYEFPEGPRGPNGPKTHPLYVVVDFPDCTIDEEDKLIENMPRTCIPVPVVTQRCEKQCCSATSIPLRVCKAITHYKSQGQSIGPGNAWTKVVVRLPSDRNKTPGLAQVAISRATSLNVLAIDDSQGDVTVEDFVNIGKGNAYEKRREFEASLHDLAEQTQQRWRQRIIAMDTNQVSPTFEGGFDAVVAMYRSYVAARNNGAPNNAT